MKVYKKKFTPSRREAQNYNLIDGFLSLNLLTT